MPDEMEQIEARLAAYIDGTLPAAQRAEIEAYLKANPEHAKLISELVSLKSAVSSLPREKAPAEVLDTLQSQIERHALLDSDEESASPMRITRWPAFGSAAAVLLLAAGLGLLVYQVLPKPKSDMAILSATRPGEVSLSDAAVPAAEKPASLSARASVADVDADTDPPARRRSATVPASLGGAVLPEAVVAAPVVPDQLDQRLAANGNQAEFGMAQQNSLNNVAPGQNAGAVGGALSQNQAYFASINAVTTVSDPVRVLIVRSDDPALTQNLLVGSLAAEKTPFELADWPMRLGPSRPPTTRPTVGEVLVRLRDNGDLALADAGMTGTKPVIVRGVSGDRAYGLLTTLDQQRPGRQNAAWAGEAKAKQLQSEAAPAARAKTEAASKPAGGFGNGRAADEKMPLDALPATPSPNDLAKLTADRRAPVTEDAMLTVRPPTTLPATVPASSPATQPLSSSDLVVFVLGRSTPASQPATQPATAPTVP